MIPESQSEQHRQARWEHVYMSKSSSEASWFEAEPRIFLGLVVADTNRASSVIDVGAEQHIDVAVLRRAAR